MFFDQNLSKGKKLPRIVIYKGGTAFNYIMQPMRQLRTETMYVLPISDDGGSCKEIMRVFGGPSIGDMRATLTRLADVGSHEQRAVKQLLGHRLNDQNKQLAEEEWAAIINGIHPLWKDISLKYQGLIKSLLMRFEVERLQKASLKFDLCNGSVGNFFFTGARLTFNVLETAVLVYSSLIGLPINIVVVPAVASNHSLLLGVDLFSGEQIVGQNIISHPPSQVGVKVDDTVALPSPIKRVFYLNKNRLPVEPSANPAIINTLQEAQVVVYGIGSLWTSILPSLITKGTGESIAENKGIKIGMLNSFNDRETSDMTVMDYIYNVTEALNRYGELKNPPKAYLTHLFVVEDGSIVMDRRVIEDLGINVITIKKDAYHDIKCWNERYPAFDREEVASRIGRLLAGHQEKMRTNTNHSISV